LDGFVTGSPYLPVFFALSLAGCDRSPPTGTSPSPTETNDTGDSRTTPPTGTTPPTTTPTGTPPTPTGDTGDATPTGKTGQTGNTGDTATLPGLPTGLRLATWNLAELDVEGQGDNPRTADDLALLATYVDRLAADVVAVQEVRGVTGTETIFPAADWSAECEDRNSSQNVCVIVREASGWALTRNPDVTALNDSDPNLRQGLDLTITKAGYAPLRVLALHLKFGCFSGASYSACGVFFDQLDVVEAWIDERTTAGEAYVVLGDFNRFMTANDSAWLEIDDDDPVGADLTRSIPQGTPTPCWSGVFTEFIDHIVLDPTSAGWMQASDQLVYDETNFATDSLRLSDHCPIWADLQVPASL
jgi:endonuclease/exonuclease/phosphatase family metal-dependent hydrolase